MAIKNNTTKGTLLLAGLATGAAAWYLLKSESGRKTLTQLSGNLKGFSDAAVSKATDAFTDIKSKIGSHNL